MSKRVLLAMIFIANVTTVSTALGADISVPSGHPRLWFTSNTELEQARQWYQKNSFVPDQDDYLGLAFRGLMTESQADCQQAAAEAVDIVIDTSQISSDSARWYGETALLIYDWCYAVFTPAQRNTFTENWNEWQTILNNKPWGGPLMEANNYYWGYLRNGAEWGITSIGDNPLAQGFIDHALDFRFEQGMVAEWAPYFGKGGVPGEGTQYGRYMLGYGVIPLITTQNYGMSTLSQTNFYRENLFYLIYSTLPATTPGPPGSGCTDEYWYLFPFNDDEQFFVCFPETAKSADYGDVVSSYIRAWPGSALSGYAQQWLDQVQPNRSPWVAALTPETDAISFANLPLDYFASGAGFAYLRSDWNTDATVINLQLGVSGNLGHNHLDAGSFQVWQNKQWLTRETTSYTEHILDWKGGPQTVDALEAVGHNTVLFEGRGQKFWSPKRANQFIIPNPPDPHHDEGADGLPMVNRVQHHDKFFFASTDLSPIYRAKLNRDPCRYDWPYADSVVRDFVYVRDLNVLVILDRMKSSSDSIEYANGNACTFTQFDPGNPALSAEQVTKTFVMHSLTLPQISNQQVLINVDNEWLNMTTLLPSNSQYRIVNEGSAVGQYRIEIDQSGNPESYFLHVLQFGNNSTTTLIPQLTDNSETWTISLNNNYQVIFEKGMQSNNGELVVLGDSIPFIQCPQGIFVNENGPYWGASECVIFKDGFELD